MGKTSSIVKDRYNAKAYDEIKVRVPKGRKAELQSFVERHGQSVNGFINSLIDEAMEREKAGAAGGASTGAPVVSPAVEDGQGAVMVSVEDSPEENICSRFTSLTRTDSSTSSASTQE